jgi:hypothetical protein
LTGFSQRCLPQLKKKLLASPSTEEIFSLAATVAAALETREGENAASGETASGDFS